MGKSHSCGIGLVNEQMEGFPSTFLWVKVFFHTAVRADDYNKHVVRWDPEMRNPTFFHQSVYLHVAYHYIQIQIHRPFLTKKSALSFPSLAICTNAARSCAHVLEVSLTRGTPVNFITIASKLFHQHLLQPISEHYSFSDRLPYHWHCHFTNFMG